MLLAVLFKVALLHLSVKQVLVSALPQDGVIKYHEQEIPLKPSAYIIGAHRDTLIICRGKTHETIRSDRRADTLELHVICKGLRRKAHPHYFSTTNDANPSVTTARVIITSHAIKKNKEQIICYCTDESTKKTSHGFMISMKPERNSISSISNHFKPKRNRVKTVALLSSLKISWRFSANSSSVYCSQDGQSLTEDQVVRGEGKISVVINEVFHKNAGFYYCRSKSGDFSSWLKLQVKGGWSKWNPWLACSSQCGAGKKIETRRCLESKLEQCQGPSVRALPCVGRSCQGMLPQFIDEPADQVILNHSSTQVTCAAHIGASVLTVQMFCSSNGSKITYSMTQNKTTVGSVHNNTVARVTYKVELHRARSNLSVVYCHCYAFTSQLTKISRIAKISFFSANDGYESSTASAMTESQVETVASKGFSNQIYIGLGVSIVLFICALIFFIRTMARKNRPLHGTANEETPYDIESYDTETVRYSEPPDTKVATLHSSVSSENEDIRESRDSNSPLLKNYLQEHSEPADDCAPYPSDDLGRETECDNESVFYRGGSCKSNKSKMSAFSSVSAGCCPRPKFPDTIDPDLCAWGQFTEKGGQLKIEGTGVSLYIPTNALPEQTSHVIYIGLMNSKGNYPKLNNREALLSPVVVCGPDGLMFDKPVLLTVPHNAVLDENNCWNPKVQSCSTVNEEEGENKWKVLERPSGDVPLSHVSEKYMQIMVDHFTNFAVVGEASCFQESGAQLKAWIIAYYTEPKVDEDCIARVYCVPATDAAVKILDGIESKLNGKISDAHKLLQISNNNKNLQITSKNTHEGWSTVTEEQKFIPFKDIWQCIEHSPNVSFIFERSSPQVFKFRSTFDARQEESDSGVEVVVSFCIKVSRRISSGYESQVNGCQIDAKYKIPIEIRREICLRLDPEDPMFNDWRHFAEKLGKGKVYTNHLKGNKKIKSPTDELIEMWEMTLSEDIPLSRVLEIFCEMKRPDVVEVLKKIPGLENTSEELSC